MNPTKETLYAFLDGELDARETARVAELVDRDPSLKAFVADQERLRERLRTDLNAMLTAPIPDKLLRTAQQSRRSLWQRLKHMIGGPLLPTGSFPRIAVPAFAAAIGIVVGVELAAAPFLSGDHSALNGGTLFASGNLGNVLDHQLASAGAAGQARIGVTFRDKSGSICRSFSIAEANATSDGYACRRGSAWQIRGYMSEPARAASSEYGLASSSMPDALRTAMDGDIAGAPFDAKQERESRDRGWN